MTEITLAEMAMDVVMAKLTAWTAAAVVRAGPSGAGRDGRGLVGGCHVAATRALRAAARVLRDGLKRK